MSHLRSAYRITPHIFLRASPSLARRGNISAAISSNNKPAPPRVWSMTYARAAMRAVATACVKRHHQHKRSNMNKTCLRALAAALPSVISLRAARIGSSQRECCWAPAANCGALLAYQRQTTANVKRTSGGQAGINVIISAQTLIPPLNHYEFADKLLPWRCIPLA